MDTIEALYQHLNILAHQIGSDINIELTGRGSIIISADPRLRTTDLDEYPNDDIYERAGQINISPKRIAYHIGGAKDHDLVSLIGDNKKVNLITIEWSDPNLISTLESWLWQIERVVKRYQILA